jgi:hypothetical protein
MKKIILLMSFIVLTTIAHAITYTSVTRCTNGVWSNKCKIKTTITYNEKSQLITISSPTLGKLVLKVQSSKTKDGVEMHLCKNIKTNLYYIVMITVENGIPYVSLSPSEDTIYLFGF